MSDKAPRSAYEIVMERLQRKDEEEGIERRSLTDEQKAEIAEVRKVYEAKLAQEEVLHASALRRTFDPAERETLEDGYRRERERLIGERDAKIERIRMG
jgi:hypothetical protein